jgi:hypothetical protein
MTFVIMTEFLHMSKELNDLSDHVLSHWFPMWKDFPRKYEQEDHAVKEAFEGQPARTMTHGKCLPKSNY